MHYDAFTEMHNMYKSIADLIAVEYWEEYMEMARGEFGGG